MAQSEAKKFDGSSIFPGLSLDLVGGGSLTVPQSQWSVFLFYRGNW